MRRRLEAYFPIVMLVLLAQLLAPISATRAAAQMIDMMATGAICAGMESSDQPSFDHSQSPAEQHQCCVMCAMAMGGAVALEPPTPLFVIIKRYDQKISWLEATDPIELARIGSHAQARAPPVAS